jgi:hypothetical protein
VELLVAGKMKKCVKLHSVYIIRQRNMLMQISKGTLCISIYCKDMQSRVWRENEAQMQTTMYANYLLMKV